MDFEVTCSGLAQGKPPDSCIAVIFGVTGDLARNDLVPSLFALRCHNLLPSPFAVVGFSRRELTDDELRRRMKEQVVANGSFDESQWRQFAGNMHYVAGDFTSAANNAYRDLKTKITDIQNTTGISDNILFHLSTPPQFYGDIVAKLEAAGLLQSDCGWRRVIIEKPFGANERSARELDEKLLQVLDETQLYRVDHFLGKETVQNMLVFRFANPGFEPIWNRDHIDHVQITAAESEGVGTRGNFYEATGVVRDMMQNHLLQLLCLTAMEPPVAYDGNSLRDETCKVLRSLRQLDVKKDCVLGQYGAGELTGETVPGYRQEENVARDSTTPTFAAMRFAVDNWRWSGVPFYLRTGKRMRRKLTSISIHFKPTPHLMFPLRDPTHLQRNVLTFHLQPDEAILHTFLAKQPGPDICLTPVTMNFRYDRAFGLKEMPGAYQWLLLDAMQGDQTLFPRSDWIYQAWSLVDPVIENWQTRPAVDLPNYTAGTWGPEDANRLLDEDGQKWHAI